MIEGFWWLFLTIGVAGIVRGFTGFGTALIFVPVAGRFLPASDVIILITLTGLASTSALLPRAWGQGNRREVALLLVAALPTVPVGIWAMGWLDDVIVRWIVAGVAGGTLLSLMTGLRYDGRIGWAGLLGIGALAGLVGGMTGLTGPVIIIAYLASRHGAQEVRANTILFLAGLDLVIFANLMFGGQVAWALVWVAALLSIPYFTTTLLGQSLFDPRHERLYRSAAYGVIALAVLTGLPIWG
ncbi:TSUP family transporter [Octadecabacter sp. R77987]|uniref:TSUP family transporter n=1 Tax=Octadecabacter sp. R77987 TaxID=3093874 RepID=UPI00366D205D